MALVYANIGAKSREKTNIFKKITKKGGINIPRRILPGDAYCIIPWQNG